jgi:hypothetical protein
VREYFDGTSAAQRDLHAAATQETRNTDDSLEVHSLIWLRKEEEPRVCGWRCTGGLLRSYAAGVAFGTCYWRYTGGCVALPASDKSTLYAAEGHRCIPQH